MGRRKKAVTEEMRQERARVSRRECDSRAAGWHNIMLAMLQLLGHTLVVQKPSKLRPRATLPRVPCVVVARGGETVYDMHRNVGLFNTQVDIGQKRESMRKGFHVAEKSVVFNVLVDELEAASGASGGQVSVTRSSRQPSRGSAVRRGDSRPRLERIEFFGHVVTADNVVACGRRVYEFCCLEYAGVAKARDVAMVPIPPSLWGVPRVRVCGAGVSATDDAMSDCACNDERQSNCNCKRYDDTIALDLFSHDGDCENDGVVTGGGCN